MRRLISTTLFMAASVSIGQGYYIDAKAWLAQALIANSWSARAADSVPSKPWPWFDAQVIARLSVPRLGIEQYVLDNASGQALAFGPGQLAESAPLASDGHSVISGHRDTHFAFLEQTRVGDIISAQHFNGAITRYRVVEMTIIDADFEPVPIVTGNALSLVTCYPFNSVLPGGSQRYIVQAKAISERSEHAEPDEAAEPAVVQKRAEAALTVAVVN